MLLILRGRGEVTAASRRQRTLASRAADLPQEPRGMLTWSRMGWRSRLASDNSGASGAFCMRALCPLCVWIVISERLVVVYLRFWQYRHNQLKIFLHTANKCRIFWQAFKTMVMKCFRRKDACVVVDLISLTNLKLITEIYKKNVEHLFSHLKAVSFCKCKIGHLVWGKMLGTTTENKNTKEPLRSVIQKLKGLHVSPPSAPTVAHEHHPTFPALLSHLFVFFQQALCHTQN